MTKKALHSRDDSNIPILTTTHFITLDWSDTPKTSPLSFSSTTIELKTPKYWVELVLQPTEDLLISEDPLFATYTIIFANTGRAFWISNEFKRSIYIKSNWTDWTLYFDYQILNNNN